MRRRKLILWRYEKRLKQKDVCEALGITYPHYSNIERGVGDPSYAVLMKFREVYSDVKDVLELFEKEECWNGNNN